MKQVYYPKPEEGVGHSIKGWTDYKGKVYELSVGESIKMEDVVAERFVKTFSFLTMEDEVKESDKVKKTKPKQKGLAKAVEEKKVKIKKVEKKKEAKKEKDIDDLDWNELRELGTEKGVYKVGMKKAEVVAALKK